MVSPFGEFRLVNYQYQYHNHLFLCTVSIDFGPDLCRMNSLSQTAGADVYSRQIVVPSCDLCPYVCRNMELCHFATCMVDQGEAVCTVYSRGQFNRTESADAMSWEKICPRGMLQFPTLYQPTRFHTDPNWKDLQREK